jgi:lipopolysaccharide/colanic/teichoic acid biosynthesis glycosyltransferase
MTHGGLEGGLVMREAEIESSYMYAPQPQLFKNVYIEDTRSFHEKRAYNFAKRAMDIICSLAAIIVFSPLLLIIAIAIMADDFGNPVFAQKRTGKDGKEFLMLKFRSMYKDAEKRRAELLQYNEADGPIFKLKNDPRVTKVGAFIRRTSLDELLQLFNVLVGSMTIVGPRPLPTYEQAQCDAYQSQRLLVKPGLSCYWQVSGRSDTDFAELIELDLKYIRERSLWTDIKIIIKTVLVVVKSKGAY